MTDTTIDEGPGRVRPFADVLRDIQGGAIADEAAILMQQLVAAVRTHGKKGSLRLDVEVQPMKGNETALMVSAKAAIKPPAGEPTTAVFFFDKDSNLVREDPRQLTLPGVLREVNQAINYDNVKEVR